MLGQAENLSVRISSWLQVFGMKYPMHSPRRWLQRNSRLIIFLGSFFTVVGIQTVLYWWGMRTIEGDARSLLESLGITIQSLTTTGYGQDAPWDSTFISMLTMAMQFTGIAYLFVALPLFIIPWVRESVTGTSVPEEIEAVEDHVVLFRSPELFDTLLDDIDAKDSPYVILEDDSERAQELIEDGRHVVTGSVTDDDTLNRINIDTARACVVDARGGKGIDTVLSVSALREDIEIVCVIEDPSHSQFLRYAGATTVISPKHRLGKALADKTRNFVISELDSMGEFDASIEIAEFPVAEGSRIWGKPMAAVDALPDIDAELIGAWIRGNFETDFQRQEPIDENTVLVATGTDDELNELHRLTGSPGTTATSGDIAIAGHGVVGTTADGILRKGGRRTVVIDESPGGDVDVVGDATQPNIWGNAELADASTLVLALPNDEQGIRACLVARECHPDIEMLVAARDVKSTRNYYRAGADYVLSLPRLVGRMITLELFDQQVLTLREQVRLRQMPADQLAGHHPSDPAVTDANIRVVAVRRDGSVMRTFDADFSLTSDDEIIIAGPDSGINEFEEAWGG